MDPRRIAEGHQPTVAATRAGIAQKTRHPKGKRAPTASAAAPASHVRPQRRAPASELQPIQKPKPLPSPITLDGPQLFASTDFVESILKSLLASLDTTMPHGLGTKITDPVALGWAITRCSEQLEHLEPGTALVADARLLLKDLPAVREYADPAHLRTAIANLEKIACRYKQLEPDGADASAVRHAQQVLSFSDICRNGTDQALAQRIRALMDLGARSPSPASEAILAKAGGLALSVARLLLPGISLKAAQTSLEQANATLGQASDPGLRAAAQALRSEVLERMASLAVDAAQAKKEEWKLRPRAGKTVRQLDYVIAAFRKIQPDSPDVATVKEACALLIRIRKGAISPVGELDRHFERLNQLQDVALENPARDDNVVQMLEQASITLAAQTDLRGLQDTLLAMQHRLAMLAIQNVARLAKRQNGILENHAYGILRSFPVRSIVSPAPADPDRIALHDAIDWLRRKQLLQLAKTTSERFAAKWQAALQHPSPSERSFSKLFLEAAVSSSRDGLFKIVNQHPQNLRRPIPEIIRLWRIAIGNKNFTHAAKLDFTCLLYRQVAMPSPHALVSEWEDHELRTQNLELSIAALLKLDREATPAPGWHAQHLQQWRALLASTVYRLPLSLHDLMLGTLPHGSLERTQRTLATGSDQATRAALEAHIATHGTSNLQDFLAEALRQRKSASVGLLLQHGALPAHAAEAESFLAPPLNTMWHRFLPRRTEAGHAAMLNIVRQLANAGVPATCSDGTGHTMFHAAASYAGPDEENAPTEHQLDVMRTLLAHGAEINRPDRRGRTALAARLEQRGETRAWQLEDPVVLFLHEHGGTLSDAIEHLREGRRRLEQSDLALHDIDRERLLRMNHQLLTKLSDALDAQNYG